MSLAALIAAQKAEHRIPHVVSCRALGVSPAWFYKWRHGDGSPRRRRRKALAATIAYLFHKHKGTYGSPRITADLRAMGWRVSPNTVAALMREQDLIPVKKILTPQGHFLCERDRCRWPLGASPSLTPEQRSSRSFC